MQLPNTHPVPTLETVPYLNPLQTSTVDLYMTLYLHPHSAHIPLLSPPPTPLSPPPPLSPTPSPSVSRVLQAVLSSQAGERVPIYSPKSDKVAHRGAVSATMATMWEHYGFRLRHSAWIYAHGHVLMIDERRKEEISKQGQTKNKAN